MDTTKFNFQVVPLADALPEKAHLGEQRRPVVLVVDDEHLIADTLSAILSRFGFLTFTAYSAEAAIDMASVVPPDVLVTDVRMPGMSGIDLGMALSCSVPDCKVLLFSAYTSETELDRARDAGFNFPMLAKPVHPVEVLSRVSACLDNHHAFTSSFPLPAQMAR